MVQDAFVAHRGRNHLQARNPINGNRGAKLNFSQATRRVTRDGIVDATNPICGYLVVEAETIEDAARLFADHPHIRVFPGDGVDIMPFVTEPKQ